MSIQQAYDDLKSVLLVWTATVGLAFLSGVGLGFVIARCLE